MNFIVIKILSIIVKVNLKFITSMLVLSVRNTFTNNKTILIFFFEKFFVIIGRIKVYIYIKRWITYIHPDK